MYSLIGASLIRMPERKKHFELHQMLHLFGLVLLVLCMETVFMEAMLTPCPSPPDYILFQLCGFPVNYNEDCLLGSILQFWCVCFFGGGEC